MRANSLLMKGALVTSDDEDCHPMDKSPFNMQFTQEVPGFGLKKQHSQAVPHMSPMGSVYPSPSLNFTGPQISFPLNTFSNPNHQAQGPSSGGDFLHGHHHNAGGFLNDDSKGDMATNSLLMTLPSAAATSHFFRNLNAGI
jgi:hypothetical protein